MRSSGGFFASNSVFQAVRNRGAFRASLDAQGQWREDGSYIWKITIHNRSAKLKDASFVVFSALPGARVTRVALTDKDDSGLCAQAVVETGGMAKLSVMRIGGERQLGCSVSFSKPVIPVVESGPNQRFRVANQIENVNRDGNRYLYINTIIRD